MTLGGRVVLFKTVGRAYHVRGAVRAGVDRHWQRIEEKMQGAQGANRQHAVCAAVDTTQTEASPTDAGELLDKHDQHGDTGQTHGNADSTPNLPHRWATPTTLQGMRGSRGPNRRNL